MLLNAPLMDLIQDTLEHSCCPTLVASNNNFMSPTTTSSAALSFAPSSGGASSSCGVVVLDQVGSPPVLLPKSPLTAHNQQQPSPQQQSSLKSSRNRAPLTSSPLKNHLPQPHPHNNSNHHNVKGNNENSRFRQPPQKHARFNQANNTKNVYRRNNSLLSKVVFHSKQQVNNNNESSKMNGGDTLANGTAKAQTCDIINGKNLTKRPHLNGNGSSGGGYKKNSKVDFASYANTKNCKRAVSFNAPNHTDEASRPKKTRRSRKRPKKQRAYEERDQDQQAQFRNNPNKRMRTWTECNADEVSRLHRNCMQKGQPLAPYNTTQFIMNEHNAEKEIDFDELSGQIQQMHNSRKQSSALAPSLDSSSLDISVGGTTGGAGSDQESVRDDYYYSSPEDESFFLEQQFHEAYDTMHAERLNNMSKDDLLKEYLQIEKELEILRQKSPGSSSNATDAKLALMASAKSPRPTSKPSSPRHQQSGSKESSARVSTPHRTSSQHHHHNRNHHHHHQCNGGTSHRNLFKENKHLRKLLKQVYNRYNSLLYCISYVNNTSNPSTSTNSTSESTSNSVAAALDESGISFSTTNQDVVIATGTPDFHLTNELQYRIEKFIAHQPQSPLSSSSSDSSNSDMSSPSSSYTSTSSHSSGSSNSSNMSDSSDSSTSDEHQRQGPLHQSGEDTQVVNKDQDPTEENDAATAIPNLLQELVDLVAEGN